MFAVPEHCLSSDKKHAKELREGSQFNRPFGVQQGAPGVALHVRAEPGKNRVLLYVSKFGLQKACVLEAYIVYHSKLAGQTVWPAKFALNK